MKTRFVLIGAAGLIVAACSGKSKTMSDDLKKDLDWRRTSDGLTLAAPAAKGSQVVSAIERTTPPAPRQVAQSQRVVKHKPAPKAPPAPVETQVADVSDEVVAQPVVQMLRLQRSPSRRRHRRGRIRLRCLRVPESRLGVAADRIPVPSSAESSPSCCVAAVSTATSAIRERTVAAVGFPSPSTRAFQ